MSSSSIEIKAFAAGRKAFCQKSVRCPPDKSVTHRSVMLAAMAKGESRIQRPLMGADCRSTMAVFRAMGVTITESGTEVLVSSPGWDGWQSPLTPLDFGNSGTTARLLTGVFAATPGLFVTAFGDGSLSQRPMGRVTEPLKRIGAQITGRDHGKLLPMAISGQSLAPASHEVDKATAQVKSALLLAGLNVAGITTVTLPAGSRDHTERMLQALGADLKVDRQSGRETVTLKGPFRPKAGTFVVPGDPSSAAFFAVLGVMTAGEIHITEVLDNQTRTGFLTVLGRMGAQITRVASQSTPPGLLEPVSDLVIKGGFHLVAAVAEAELAPTLIDEIPVLAVAALFAKGVSRFCGLSELRVKESDRLAKTIELITLAGGRAWSEKDDLLVEGELERVKAFHYNPDEDHRLAMAAAILAKVADGPCQIQDPDCVRVSFPGFFDVLAGMG